MKKAKILIVEDEMVTAEDLRSTLIRMNYEPVAVVPSGELAVKKAEQLKPDLVLMDIKLKGELDGIQAAKIIHGNFGIPVIYLTAFADSSLLDRAKLTNPYGYVVKPFSEKELHSSLEIGIYKSRSDRQIHHLNSVLKAIRNINQLITHEKDSGRLIKQACDMLVESRSYVSAWIILLDKEGQYLESAETGLGDTFNQITDRYRKGNIPTCGLKAKKTNGSVIIENIAVDCPDCPIEKNFPDRIYIQTRLVHMERLYGILSVGFSREFEIKKEELELMQEVADDLAFALYTFKADADNKKLEEQLKQSQKLEAIGSLVSGVTHEINNPLTGMINYADLIHEKTTDSELKEFAKEIMVEGNRIDNIVKNLLAFSRTSKNQVIPVLLADVINGTLTLVNPSLKKDQIQAEVDIPDDLELVTCNSQQIQQIVLNLITNAQHALNKRYKKWDDDKKLIIKIRPHSIDDHDGQQIIVEDHGSGIPKKTIDKIFTEFFTTKPEGEGTGLGLSVSTKIIEEHGGTLTVESEENKYTRFYINLRQQPEMPE